jgi:phosphatidate phosphatase APP1
MAYPLLILKAALIIVILVLFGGCALNQPYSNIESNEVILFFNTDAYLDKNTKDTWIIPIHGWAYEPQNSHLRKSAISELFSQKYGLQRTPENQHIFDRRINLILSDNERGKTVWFDIAGKREHSLQSSANGHFFSRLTINDKEIRSDKNQKSISFCAVLDPTDSRQFCGMSRLINDHGISVISDIDDTVKITQVTDHARMFENTFYKPYEAVPGMANVFQQWSLEQTPIHFVSSSPWYLYPELDQFLKENNFPDFSMSLKYFRFRDTTFFNLFKSGMETKPKQIEELLVKYPSRKFVLVGDSGEQDPEVYTVIKTKFPQQIVKVFIRNVSTDTLNNKRYSDLIHMMGHNFILFDSPSELPSSLLK